MDDYITVLHKNEQLDSSLETHNMDGEYVLSIIQYGLEIVHNSDSCDTLYYTFYSFYP